MNMTRVAGLAERISFVLAGAVVVLALAASPVKAASGDDLVIQPPPSHDKAKSKLEESEASPSSATVQERYTQALELIEAKQYDNAFTILASLNLPENVNVLKYLGFTSRKLGRMKESQKYYESALRLEPGNLGVLEYYGEWHVTQGDLETANEHLQKIARLCGVYCREYKMLAAKISNPDAGPQDDW